MKRIALVLAIVGVVISGMLAFVAVPVRAQDATKATCLTFSEPVELPNVALTRSPGPFTRGTIQRLSVNPAAAMNETSTS